MPKTPFSTPMKRSRVNDRVNDKIRLSLLMNTDKAITWKRSSLLELRFGLVYRGLEPASCLAPGSLYCKSNKIRFENERLNSELYIYL